MADKLFLFLTTADESLIQAHKERLNQEFDLNIYRDIADCRSALQNHAPQVLLLDTRVPEAVQFHQEIKDDFMTSDVHMVLLCTDNDVTDDGYRADDFLLHPLSDGVFWRKLAQIQKTFEDRTRTQEQMSYAQGVALTAMSSMGELGVVMQFLSKSFDCETITDVAQLALDSLRQYELEGAIHILWEGDSHTTTTQNEPLSDELQSLIEQRRTLGRILEINDRMVVNYDHVTLLITNLPEDSQRRGRVRDNIVTLAEGIESRIHGLLLIHDNVLKQQGIRYAVFEIRDSVRNLGERQMADLLASRALVNNVIDDYEDAFMHMNIVPEVENQLISQLVTLRQRIGDIVSRPGEVHDKLQTVVTAMETLAGQVATDPLS